MALLAGERLRERRELLGRVEANRRELSAERTGDDLLLEGEGVAALARSPELLLGVLEGVDGMAARGRTVRVLAPTPTTLMVADGSVPDDAMEAAAVWVVLGSAPSEGLWERLGFRARVRLPERGGGTFPLSLAD